MKEYLDYSKASKISDPKARKIYRCFEILPGALSWLTLLGAIFLSWYRPAWVACFIITFVIFWLLRTLYFSAHLSLAFRQMKKHQHRDWLKKLNQEQPNWKQIYQLVILPMYKEPVEIIRGSFEALDKASWPNQNMIVVLATEQKAGPEAQQVAQTINQEFKGHFFKLLITTHPQDLPGEIAGKGSNETWAAKKAKKLIDDLNPVRDYQGKKKEKGEQVSNGVKIPYSNIIVSSLDSDTVVPPQYFSCLTYYYLTTEKPTRTSYQPIPLFTNNIWKAPSFSRVFSFSSTFWHSMNQERPKKLVTFSSHSMSFQALVDVGFKQTDVVSDDSRIFWQCFLNYNGDYKVQPIYYPVCMDANVAPSLFKTAINIYKQQRRWAYGVGDVPYFLFGFLRNKKIPLSRKFSLGLELIEGHWSWATSSIIIFLLGWLPLVLGGSGFNQTLLSYNLPRITSKILTIAMIGLISSAFFSLILIPPKPPHFGRYRYLLMALEWVLLPILMIFFTALPALDAQTRWLLGKYMGFWPTKKTRKS